MAEEIVVGGVEEIVKRLISLGIDEIGLLRGVKEEVEKLQTIFTHIQLVLQDADKRQVGDERVKLWLHKLKEAAYDAEDILAEFAFDALRRQVLAKTKSCTGLRSLEGLQSLRNIRSLSIGPFSEELDHFPFLDAMEMGNLIFSLRSLSIDGWSRLKSLPEQIQYLSLLKSLCICNFDGMTDLPEWFGKLTSLEDLMIWRCKNLMHLPSANEMQKLTSLRKLEILRCPLLKERCKPPKKRCGLGSGSSEWHKIPRITKVDVDEEDEDDSSSLSRLVDKMCSKVC